MRLLKQLEFAFERSTNSFGLPRGLDHFVVGRALRLPHFSETATGAVALQFRGRAIPLETRARELLQALHAEKLAREIRVAWNSRLQTAAGRADYHKKLISLNPRLFDHGLGEIDRTLRHELAHLLAQFRAGRRRILPHGTEWREACRDLGIADEVRCHTLPFTSRTYAARFVYRCPNCQRDFPRVRRVRRAVACLACCHAYNGGEFDSRFRLQLDGVLTESSRAQSRDPVDETLRQRRGIPRLRSE
jgi:SprT protein